MSEFDQYLPILADLEWQKAENWTDDDPRQRIQVAAGVALNWLGDFVGNPAIQWQKRSLPIDQLRFTGTSAAWNKVLIDQCQRLPSKLAQLLEEKPEAADQFSSVMSEQSRSLLVRRGDEVEEYKVLDGMELLIAAVIKNESVVEVFIPINEDEMLPSCEAHVVYDLLRGCERRAKDELSLERLHQALLLLSALYVNVPDILRNRFNRDRMKDDQINAVISKVLTEINQRASQV